MTAICDLVNVAYRGGQGWTRETDIVAGDRVQAAEIAAAISGSNSHMFVCRQRERVVACVCVEMEGDVAQIGMFAVDPECQGAGLGGKVLALAEDYASQQLGASKFVVVVVSQRPELIAYYERRGYRRTGKIQDYPTRRDDGTPLAPGLTVEYLEKRASA